MVGDSSSRIQEGDFFVCVLFMDSLLQLIACSGGELLFRNQATKLASFLPEKGVEKDGKGTV